MYTAILCCIGCLSVDAMFWLDGKLFRLNPGKASGCPAYGGYDPCRVTSKTKVEAALFCGFDVERLQHNGQLLADMTGKVHGLYETARNHETGQVFYTVFECASYDVSKLRRKPCALACYPAVPAPAVRKNAHGRVDDAIAEAQAWANWTVRPQYVAALPGGGASTMPLYSSYTAVKSNEALRERDGFLCTVYPEGPAQAPYLQAAQLLANRSGKTWSVSDMGFGEYRIDCGNPRADHHGFMQCVPEREASCKA